VAATAIDSSGGGFNTYVIKDACRHIYENTSQEMEEEFIKKGVKVINSTDLKDFIK